MTTIEAHPLGRAALVLGVALLLFAAALLAGDGSEEIPAAPSATPDLPTATAGPATATSTATPTPTATPEPTATPRPGPEPAFGELPPGLELDDAGAWVRQTLAPGEQPTADHGVLIRNIEHGASEHWSLVNGPAPGAEFFAYGVAGDGRFGRFGSPFEARLLVDRVTGTAFRWDTDDVRLIAASADGRLLLGTTQAENNVCLFWAADVETGAPEPLLRFGLDGDSSCAGVSGLFGPAGSETLILSANNNSTGDDGTIHVVDLAAGAVESLAHTPRYRTLTPDGGGARWIVPFGDPAEDEALGFTLGRYDWETGGSSATRIEATATGERAGLAIPSPDGALIAWQESLRLGSDFGLGGYFEWPVLIVADRESGEPLLRVIRAAITNGIETTRWLADSSGLVISIEGRFALLELNDTLEGTVAALPFPHELHFEPLPVPAPNNPALFAYDERFVDRTGAEVLPPLVVDWARQGPRRGDWTSGGSEYYLAVWDPGAVDFGAGPVAAFGLEPRVQIPPFSNDVRLALTEATELREAPDRTSEASWPLEAGVVVTVQNDESLSCRYEFGCATRADPDFTEPRPQWFFVRTEDGRAGWAESTALAWAE